MLRATTYIVLGWVLIAVVGGLADVVGLTVMLPATSAILVTHAAFSRDASVPAGLAVAVALGYLEDVHQGAPVGTLCLAHVVAFLGLRWAAGRVHLRSWLLQALASVFGLVLVDFATIGTLVVLAEPLGVRREALLEAAGQMRWHALATLLAAPAVWLALDRLLVRLRLDERPTPS